MSYRESPPPKLRGGVGSQSAVASKLIEYNQQRLDKIYSYPATVDQALIHEMASSYGHNTLLNADGSPVAVCPCCEMPINTLPLALNYPTTPGLGDQFQEDYKLSAGMSLFFSFIKMTVVYLTMRFLVTDAFNLLSSAAGGSYCRSYPDFCGSGVIGEMSAYNKISEQGLVWALDILNLLTVLLSMVYFVLYRKFQYAIGSSINQAQHTQDDYTLYISHIPILLLDSEANQDNLTFDYEKRLQSFFDEKIDNWLSKVKDTPAENQERIERELLEVTNGVNLDRISKVRSITLCFDLSQMEILQEMRTKLMTAHKQAEEERKKQAQKGPVHALLQKIGLQRKDAQVKLLNRQLIRLSQKFAEDSSLAFNLTHFVGRGFISFEYQHLRDYVLREFERDKQFLKMGEDSLKVALAAAPSDIFWYNMKVQGRTRLKYIVISYLVLIMVLTFAFAAVLSIDQFKMSLTRPNAEAAATILTILTTVLTLAINAGLAAIVRQLTEYQRHETRSKHLISLIVKTVVTQFINTAIIYYVSEEISPTPYLSEEGLVFQVSSLFLTSAIIQVVMNVLHPEALFRSLKRWLARRKGEEGCFQVELNVELELPEFDVAGRYSYYILQIFTCSFYSYLTPLAVLCLLPTLCAQYWIDKYNLFRRCSLKHEIDFQLSRAILKIFECSLLLFAVGNVLFSLVLHKTILNKVNVASLIISAIYCAFSLLAPRHLEQRLFGRYEQIEKTAYTDCLRNRRFKHQYWTQNPATMFVKEIDLNTNKEVNYPQTTAKIADLGELAKAKQRIEDEIEKMGNASDFESLQQELNEVMLSNEARKSKEVRQQRISRQESYERQVPNL